MRLAAVAGAAAFAAGKALLVAAVPLQSRVTRDRATHGFINEQARLILDADGYAQLASVLRPMLPQMERGSIWADAGWKSVSHMYDPRSGKGFWDWPTAPVVCEEYYTRALRAWRQGSARRTAFWLGASAHLVQDLFVPHHSCNRILDGHSAFEDLAETVRDQSAVYWGGSYDRAATPGAWVRHAAWISQDYMAQASGPRQQQLRAIGELLPMAERATAGFLAFFFRRSGGID